MNDPLDMLTIEGQDIMKFEGQFSNAENVLQEGRAPLFKFSFTNCNIVNAIVPGLQQSQMEVTLSHKDRRGQQTSIYKAWVRSVNEANGKIEVLRNLLGKWWTVEFTSNEIEGNVQNSEGNWVAGHLEGYLVRSISDSPQFGGVVATAPDVPDYEDTPEVAVDLDEVLLELADGKEAVEFVQTAMLDQRLLDSPLADALVSDGEGVLSDLIASGKLIQNDEGRFERVTQG